MDLPSDRRHRHLTAGVLAALILLGGCGTSGRELRPVSPDQTAPPRTEQAGGGPTSLDDAVSTSSTDSGALTLSAPDFGGGDALPASATCDGDGVSPALTWSGVPETTTELALVATDVDADSEVVWAVTAIPAGDGGSPEGAAPEAALVHANADGASGWLAVCPPEGELHTIELALHALGEPLGLDAAADGPAVVAALAERVAAGTDQVTVLVATVQR